MEYQACRPRRDDGGTPFTNWLRMQPGLESNVHVGYVTTDLDIVWYNYVLAKLMLLEQKRGDEEYTPSQRTTHAVLDQCLQKAALHPDFTLQTPEGCLPIPAKVDYCGLHLIRFEHSSPEDGRMWLDGRPISKVALMRFLQFKWTPAIQVYNAQQKKLLTSSNLVELETAATTIRESISPTHPETKILRELYRRRKQELLALEVLFSHAIVNRRHELSDEELALLSSEEREEYQQERYIAGILQWVEEEEGQE